MTKVINFQTCKPKFIRKHIKDIEAGEMFIAAYHDPNRVLAGEEEASLYLKLPKTPRCIPDVEGYRQLTAREIAGINERRVAFNLTRNTTKVFDAHIEGYLVDADIAVALKLE